MSNVKFYQTLTFEKYYPLFFGGLVLFLCFYLAESWMLVLPRGDSFLSSVVTLGGIFAGFTLTLKAFVLSDVDRVKKLQESSYYDVYMSYVTQSIDVALLLSASAIFGFFGTLKDNNMYLSFLVSMTVISLLCVRRSAKISTATITAKSRPKAG